MKFWPLLALLLAPLVVNAVTLDDLQQRFANQPVIRAHFSQTRNIKDMPQPLHAQGELLIARDKGLLWRQTAPFAMTLVLTDARMVQALAGQAAQVITAQNNPQLFQFNQLLRALFQAKRQVLEQNFHIDFQSQGPARWTLRLTPIGAPLNKIFNSINLSGQNYLENIELQDQQGDRTAIVLSQHRTTPTQPSDDELAQFAVH